LKLFIILILFAVFITLLYLRLRPYIKVARQMFGVARGVRNMSRNEPVHPLRSEAATSNKLLRCDACGTWIPASRAVKLRSSLATYCSHACMEASAVASNKRKTAG
jgi:hypothetical protein